MHGNKLTAAALFATALLVPTVGLAASLEDETARRSDGLAIRGQMQSWDKALIENKPDELANILSSEYFGGGVSRELYVAAFEAMGLRYTESSRDNVEIRFYGETAFVSGQWTQRGTTSQFGTFTSTFRFTDLWVKHAGIWKCVATSPDQMRQAYAKLKPVRVGPDVKADVVVLFNVGVSAEDIELFRKTHLSENREASPAIRSYARLASLDEHAVVALQLKGDYSDVQRKFFIEALLREPIVFRVFENVAPDGIILGK